VKALDCVVEIVTANEAHRIEWPPIGVLAQPVNRDDPRVFQPTGDLCLLEKAQAPLWIVRVPFLDLLEGDFTMELLIERHEDFSEPPFSVRP
jgi:hypothetical protein